MNEDLFNFAELDSIIKDALHEYSKLLHDAHYPAGARVCYDRLRDMNARVRFLARKFGHIYY